MLCSALRPNRASSCNSASCGTITGSTVDSVWNLTWSSAWVLVGSEIATAILLPRLASATTRCPCISLASMALAGSASISSMDTSSSG